MDIFEIIRILAIVSGGLMAGSFINCVIWRLHSGESFIAGRSYCPHCRHSLAARDLIPIFSFISLKGRCRYCCKKISWRYPAVEAATASLALIAAYVIAPGLVKMGVINLAIALGLVYCWLIIAVLEIIFVSDLLWYIIPDQAVLAGICLAIIAQLFNILALPGSWVASHTFGNGFLTAIFSAMAFFMIFLISRGKWMGFGDVKYAFLMGLILGFPEILFGMFAAFFSGAAVGIALIAAGRKELSSEIPFGPFLVAGTLAALFFSTSALGWYLSIII